MIRIALIGCGAMGGTHRQAMEHLTGRARIVAAVDTDEALARKTAEVLGCPIVESDYRRVLDQVDAACIVLPHHLHHPVGLECLSAGLHVLMEKPLANTQEQCLDLIEAADRAKRTLMVGYCMRYHPLVREMGRLIREQTYGEVFQVSIWTEQHTRREAGHWMHKIATLGGGQFFSHGCHYIDILLDWLGDPVLGTHLGTNRGTPWMEGEGTSNVSLKFANGATAYHFGTWGARGTRLQYAFHAHCTEGMLEAERRTNRLILHRGAEEETAGQETVLTQVDPGKHVHHELVHFVECIETGRTPLTDARSSLQSLRVIWRLYDAERRNVVADLKGLGFGAASGETSAACTDPRTVPS